MINRNCRAARRSRVGRAGLCAMLAAARARARDAESVRAARSAALSEALHAEHHLRRRSSATPCCRTPTGLATTRTRYRGATSGSDLAWQTALGLVQGVNIANQNNAPYYRKFVNRTLHGSRQPVAACDDLRLCRRLDYGRRATSPQATAPFTRRPGSWSPGARSRRPSTRTRTSRGSGC